MRANVFTDASLERYAGRFVWLSVNTEQAANAAFLKQYPIPVLPTLLVLDPAKDAVAMRYVGGTTVPQLRKMLDDASATARGKQQTSADALVASADKLASANKNDEAAKLYEQALAAAPKKWSKYGRTAESYLFALQMSNQTERCATEGERLYPRVKGTTSAANVASVGLSCATGLDEKNEKRAALLKSLEASTWEVMRDPKIELTGDDRSGLYESLISARDAVKDEEGSNKLIAEWAAFLEDAAAKAPTPEARAVYDSHRVSAYLAMNTPEKAIPMLEQSERDFPSDYNPPARLAVIYKAMKKWDEALAAVDRAMSKAYGPRKLSMFTNRADILLGKGDKEGARQTMKDAIAYAKSLPDEQRSERRIAMLQKKLDSIQ